MAVIAHPSLTNSQPLGVRPWAGGRRHGLGFSLGLEIACNYLFPDRVVPVALDHLIFRGAQSTGMPYGLQASPFGLLWKRSLNIEGNRATRLTIFERRVVPVENRLRGFAGRPDADRQE